VSELASLAARAAAIDLGDLPASVRSHAATVVADTVGVIMAGTARPEVQALVAARRPADEAASGLAPVLAVELPRLSPQHAAEANAIAGASLELDEGCRPTGHPAIHVLPPALATATASRASGAQLLEALIAGYEVAARLFETYRLTYPVHPHAHFGSIGAAVAVAMLRGTAPGPAALIASSLPVIGVWDTCFDGATARLAYVGFGAATGMQAVELAEAGFTGSKTALDTLFGSIVGELVDPLCLSEPIDVDAPRITRNYFKFHSACALSHSALDAVLTLGTFAPADVERIAVETVANSMKIARQARSNAFSTRFSLQYAVAAAAVHGHTSPAVFEPANAIMELARRVEVEAPDGLEAFWPDASPARVTVELRSGETRTAHVGNPIGHHANPAGPDALREKFRSLAWVDEPDTLYDRLRAIETEPDVSELIGSLKGRHHGEAH
jgi:2-methylcitrate dehydratase PrpD